MKVEARTTTPTYGPIIMSIRATLAACFVLVSSTASADTLAYWRFEAGPDGSNVVHSAPDGVFSPDVPDVSGNGNDLSCWSSNGWAEFVYRSDVFGPTVPLTGSTNLFSVQNTDAYPVMFTEPGTPFHALTPPEWTIEAAFQPELGGFRTLVGRDSMGANAGDPNLSALYLQITPTDQLAIKYCDVSGFWHEALSDPGLVEGFVWPDSSTGIWQAAVATCDGDLLRLYYRNIEGGDPYFRLVAETDVSASGSPDTSLTDGAGSGSDWVHGTWTVARGLYSGVHGDRAYGFIDEVRISDAALEPDDFLLGGGVPYYAVVDRVTGEIVFEISEAIENMVGYTLSSSSGALDPGAWIPIADSGDADSGGFIDTNDIWYVQAATSNELEEYEPIGDGVFLPGSSFFQLGPAGTWVPGSAEDVTMELIIYDVVGSLGEYTVHVPVFFVGPTERIVLNTDDSGYGSLRRVLSDANDGDTILFDPTLNGLDIVLTSGELEVSNSVSIDASTLPEGIDVDGNNSSRVFRFLPGKTSEVKHVCIMNGSFSGDGGGIYNESELFLDGCTVAGNTATSYGGGIANRATLTIDNSTISGNSAGDSAGIDNYNGAATALLNVNNSTFANNAASGIGGGILNEQATANLENVTISGNSAEEGGGVYNFATFNINNTVVAGNIAPTNENVSGTSSGANNLTSGDPYLRVLEDNGGPTLTMRPRPGSPVIDTGGPTVLTTDQRGLPRPFGSDPDIGAVEFDPTARPIFVDTDVDENGALLPDLSLREAIDFCALYPGSTIGFEPGLSGQTISLAFGQLTLTADVEIDASPLTDGIAIDAGHSSRIISIGDTNLTAVLRRLKLLNGSEIDGGAILNYGALTIIESMLSGNTASSYGGAIENFGALNVEQSTFTGNNANNGGAVDSYSGAGIGASLMVNNSTFDGNSAVSWGGAIHNDSGSTATILHSTITENNASSGSGGGIVNYNILSLDNSIVAGNSPDDTWGSFSGSDNIVTGTVPFLAVLDDYGGPTPTRPPFPGSPALDTASPTLLLADQRGFPRNGFPDIGASEFQGAPDVDLFWNTDWDGDGNLFGYELGIGSDPLSPDPGGPGTPMALAPGITFGLNPDAYPYTAWVVYRSLDLVSDPFVQILWFDGPTASVIPDGIPLTINILGDAIEVIDDSDPLPDEAFYLLGIEPSAPPP